MKKIMTMLIITAMLSAAAVSCGKTEDPAGASGAETETTSAQELETQPDPLAPTEAEEAPETEAPAEEVTEAMSVSESDVQVDPLGAGSFELDESGAVVFVDDAAAESDRTLIAAAQSLFDSACRIEFSYTVGCPYSYDSEKTITGNFDWQYYFVTDPAITSVSDVLADYHKVFSQNHDDSDVRALYLDGDDGVYALCGGRGSDIYYAGSKITTVNSRSDSEITFTVENYYDGTDWGDPAYTETDTFSMVLEDGAWRADQFVLPY